MDAYFSKPVIWALNEEKDVEISKHTSRDNLQYYYIDYKDRNEHTHTETEKDRQTDRDTERERERDKERGEREGGREGKKKKKKGKEKTLPACTG